MRTIQMAGKIRTKTIVIILFTVLCISCNLSFSQTIYRSTCGELLNNSTPPTPYDNAYLKFDGMGDFLRTQDIDALEFNKSTTDNFTIETRFKVTKPWNVQFIMGKKYSKGWQIGYHTPVSGYVTIYFNGAGWKNIYYLGADSSWHTYKITFNKQEQVLRTYVDGNLTNTYNDFQYEDLSDGSAFSAGNVGFFPQYGPQSINLTSRWFKGCVDDIKIDVNNTNVVNYNFNEGAGQVARDSASYYIFDRTYPGESLFCDSRHLMLGTVPAKDTCDPEWVTEGSNHTTHFAPLGIGMQYIYTDGITESYSEHFSLGLAVWNGYLINGGKFNTAGGVDAKHIAKWDGSEWSSLGGGLNHEVVYMESFNNELYATGNFDTAYGTGKVGYIAKWDGSSWHDVGGGFNEAGLVMTVFNNSLYVGGLLDTAGGMYTKGIARWDGSQWHNVGGGINGTVWALCEYNGELYAAGNFNYADGRLCRGITRWDGSQWNPVGTGVTGGSNLVFVLTVYNGELYAGGSFTQMDGITCMNIAKYNGSQWMPAAGSGAIGSSCVSPSEGQVIDMEVYDNDLYVIGQFTIMDGVSANKIAKFDGTTWCGVEYGINLRPEHLMVYNGDLVVNGDFYSISGVEYNNIAKYNPTVINVINGNNNNLPSEYNLSQNYPNPFNPATTVKYSLPANGYVKISVYDAAGRLVDEPVNDSKTAGDYSFTFNASGLASGVYFYKMDVTGSKGDKFSQTKKMVLIK